MTNDQILHTLVASAQPFLRIDGMTPQVWRRDVKRGARSKPFRFQAAFSVLSDATWRQRGEVIYFVTDGAQRLRLVGQSSGRLKDRWRTSPMHDVDNGLPMGRRTLFHSTAWAAIEQAADSERVPFTVSAIFRPELERLCRLVGGPLIPVLELPQEGARLLSYQVETWICRNFRVRQSLWNRRDS
jgi:hypothetical protein